ncbi:MAG: hypothetical protein IKO25_08645 [Clostridia bacterium]|nr:hypothetical protein [Clostridia bacterium]
MSRIKTPPDPGTESDGFLLFSESCKHETSFCSMLKKWHLTVSDAAEKKLSLRNLPLFPPEQNLFIDHHNHANNQEQVIGEEPPNQQGQSDGTIFENSISRSKFRFTPNLRFPVLTSNL